MRQVLRYRRGWQSLLAALCITVLFGVCAEAGVEEGKAALEKGRFKAALAQFRPLAAQGDRDAQYWLGYMYGHGKGLPEDFSKAALWFRRAAERGQPMAQYRIGVMHAVGQGVRRDRIEAYMWLHLAAVRGVKKADKNLNWLEKKMRKEKLAIARERALSWRPCPLAKPCPQ